MVMDYFIAIILIISIISGLSYYAWFQIKEYHVDFIIRKLIALGYSTDEIRSRQVYLRKQSNKKLKEIIRELNRKEKEETPTINEENFLDPLFKTQNKSKLFTAIDPKGDFMAYDKYGNLIENLNIYHLTKEEQIKIFGRILIK